MKRFFEWDQAKAMSNLAKHDLSFEVATLVFADMAFVDMEASQPGADEVRRKAVGLIDGRIHTVVYTMRNGITRIISARRSNAKETASYGRGPIHSRPK
jgi:uncharacterized DUF497 family protein